MRLLPYAGDPGVAKWRPARSGPNRIEVAVALVLAVWPLVLLPPASAGVGLVLGAGMALPLAAAAKRLIGGQTGDVLGGVEQLFEMGFMLGVAAQFVQY
jgi:adenosylcobinamide-GDP ribazoletransferase